MADPKIHPILLWSTVVCKPCNVLVGIAIVMCLELLYKLASYALKGGLAIDESYLSIKDEMWLPQFMARNIYVEFMVL